MAPCSIAAALALPLLWRRHRAAATVLAAAFTAVWIAAAVHGGGAPGPPGRLMAPCLPLVAVPLAVGIEGWRGRSSFRWNVMALAAVTVTITITFLADWRRSVNPYRRMFASSATNFARDLPSGPADPTDAVNEVDVDAPGSPATPRWGLEVGRGLILLTALAGWVAVFGRKRLPYGPAPGADVQDRLSACWRSICEVHLAWWGTLLTLSWLLRAVRS
jgi:hypothetical protein